MHNKRSSNITNPARGLRRTLMSLAVGGMFAGVSQMAAAQTATPPPPPPPADASDAVEVQEVVVTATKRSESAQKVPLAITAIGSQELQDRGITGLSGLETGAVPTLKLEQFAGNPTTIEVGIRGFINPNGTDISTENPVPIYIDDIYNGRQQGAVLDLTEIDSLSVLRGPQGTLFGKNALGGAIQINSKRPTGHFGIRSQVEGGSFGYYKAIAHIDLPRIGDVAAKIDFIDTDSNGWQKNPGGLQADGNQTYAGTTTTGQQNNFGRVKASGERFSLRYDPSENFTVDYAGMYIRSESTGAFNQLLSSNDPYTNSVWAAQTTRADSLPYPVYRPLNNEQFVENHITASWFVSDRLTIKSITAYRDDSSLDYNTASPSSTVPGVYLGRPDLGVVTAPTVTYDIAHKQFSQEFQFIGTEKNLQWTAGLFFMNERGSQIDNTYFGLAFPNATLGDPATGFLPFASLGTPVTLAPPFALGAAAVSGADVQNLSAAGFGNVVWRPEFFDKKLALTGGLRLGMDEKRVVRPSGYIWAQPTYGQNGAPAPVPGQVDPSTGLVVQGQTCPCNPVSITERRALPLAVASYDWANNQSAYLRYATGYRAAQYALASQTLDPARADSANSFELGQKSEFWGHRARVNVAAFYTRWKTPPQSVQTASSSTVEFFNGPTIQTRGVEVDSSFVPLDGLTISVNGAYYHGHQPPAVAPQKDQAPGSSSGVAQFNNVVNLPALSGSVSVLYDFLKTHYGTWRANVDLNGTTGYFGVPNTPLEIPGYGLVNARFGLASIKLGADGGNMDLMLFGQNLTDKSYEVFNYSAAGTAPGTSSNLAAFGQRRLVGAALSYRY